MKQLKVILLEHEVGVLEQKQDGHISFAYSVEWLKSEQRNLRLPHALTTKSLPKQI